MNRRGLLALAALPPGAARAQAPEVLDLAGQPVLALATHPAVGPRLRAMAQGRQRLLSEALRGEGPPLAVSGGWVHGRARAGEARVLLAFDTRSEAVAIILYEGSAAALFVPPRFAPWPAALRAAVEGFSPQVAAALRFH
ncbi:MAG: hypothetical protein N3D18_15695 [Roseococcus sp.]|nr:hypothetical protein [Roseococcus sp.]